MTDIQIIRCEKCRESEFGVAIETTNDDLRYLVAVCIGCGASTRVLLVNPFALEWIK